jgi:hypothetical protein
MVRDKLRWRELDNTQKPVKECFRSTAFKSALNYRTNIIDIKGTVVIFYLTKL